LFILEDDVYCPCAQHVRQRGSHGELSW
jgi:hypothetical protein